MGLTLPLLRFNLASVCPPACVLSRTNSLGAEAEAAAEAAAVGGDKGQLDPFQGVIRSILGACLPFHLLADQPRARQQDHDLQLQLGANRYGAAGRRALVRSLPCLYLTH